jgi:hypothetical protein
MSEAQDETRRPDPSPETGISLSRALPWVVAIVAVAALAGVAGYLVGHGNATSSSEARSAETNAETVAFHKAEIGAGLAARKAGERTGHKLGERSGARAGASQGSRDGRAVAAKKAHEIERREEEEAEEALEAEEQAEQEAAEQAEEEYRESIHVEPDGSECSPGTGIGEPDPQCEPLPGDPDYDANRGY